MGTGDKVIGDLDKARIDNLVQQFLTVGQIPGLSLGIVRNNSELVYAQGYGFVDVDKFIETGNRTLFAIGSITKVVIIWNQLVKLEIQSRTMIFTEFLDFHSHHHFPSAE